MLISRSLAPPSLLPAWTVLRTRQSRLLHSPPPQDHAPIKRHVVAPKEKEANQSIDPTNVTALALPKTSVSKRTSKRTKASQTRSLNKPYFAVIVVPGKHAFGFAEDPAGQKSLIRLDAGRAPKNTTEDRGSVNGYNQWSEESEISRKPRFGYKDWAGTTKLVLSNVESKPSNKSEGLTKNSGDAFKESVEASKAKFKQRMRLNQSHLMGYSLKAVEKGRDGVEESKKDREWMLSDTNAMSENEIWKESPAIDERVKKGSTQKDPPKKKENRKLALNKKTETEPGIKLDSKKMAQQDLVGQQLATTSSNSNPQIKDHATTKKLSLYEILFPQEAKRRAQKLAAKEDIHKKNTTVPPLALPDFGELSRSFVSFKPSETTPAVPSREREQDLRNENLIILKIENVSPGLIDADFRQIAPRGEHIEEWRGPGDILKGKLTSNSHSIYMQCLFLNLVIPDRDQTTLEARSTYYLLFTNGPYAQRYHDHILEVHKTFVSHSPTSMLSPHSKITSNPEELEYILKNYTLSPSQTPRLSFLKKNGRIFRRLLSQIDHRIHLTPPFDGKNRAVLLWISGYSPPHKALQYAIALDGQARGLAWTCITNTKSLNSNLDGCGIELITQEVRRRVYNTPRRNGDEEEEEIMEDQFTEEEKKDMDPISRWIVTLENETEARRFVRCWHMAAYPINRHDGEWRRGEVPATVHAEILW